MSIHYPNIIGKTDSQKLDQIKNYLHQLADDLNYQLDHSGNLVSGHPSTAIAAPTQRSDSISNFNEIKSLIINNVDIISAYYAETLKLLNRDGINMHGAAAGDFVVNLANDTMKDKAYAHLSHRYGGSIRAECKPDTQGVDDDGEGEIRIDLANTYAQTEMSLGLIGNRAFLTGLTAPVNNTDAVNKAYVDGLIAALRSELGL